MTDIKKLLTLTEAADLAGVTRQAIHYALTCDPPAAKGQLIKGRWFLTREEVHRVWGIKNKSKT